PLLCSRLNTHTTTSTNITLSLHDALPIYGELEIAEDEAEIIRLIFDKYINTTMGVNGIAAWLNQQGYQKKKRQNNTLNAFAASLDRKSTRLNSSHVSISYAVFCLKKRIQQ